MSKSEIYKKYILNTFSGFYSSIQKIIIDRYKLSDL